MTTQADHDSGITNLVHGNQQDARELRANLAAFARQTDNPTIRKLVSDVLAGRRNVREIFRSPEFTAAASAHLDNLQQGLDQLTDEERAEVFDPTRPRTPQSTLDTLRAAHDPGGPLLTPETDEDSYEYHSPLKRDRH